MKLFLHLLMLWPFLCVSRTEYSNKNNLIYQQSCVSSLPEIFREQNEILYILIPCRVAFMGFQQTGFVLCKDISTVTATANSFILYFYHNMYPCSELSFIIYSSSQLILNHCSWGDCLYLTRGYIFCSIISFDLKFRKGSIILCFIHKACVASVPAHTIAERYIVQCSL